MASSNEGSAKNIDWDYVIKKEARGINDEANSNYRDIEQIL
jgi:hypothetical protein